MNTYPEAAICVATETRPGGRTRMFDVYGTSIESTKREIDNLIRRERLHLVLRSELRAMSTCHATTVNWDAVVNSRQGVADAEAWREVAKLQEPFRNHGDGWAWWVRFSHANSARACAKVLTVVRNLAQQHRAIRIDTGMPVDWMSLLREALAESSSCDASEIRANLNRLIDELTDE